MKHLYFAALLTALLGGCGKNDEPCGAASSCATPATTSDASLATDATTVVATEAAACPSAAAECQASSTAYTCPAPPLRARSDHVQTDRGRRSDSFLHQLLRRMALRDDRSRSQCFRGWVRWCGTRNCCSCEVGACPGIACFDMPLTTTGLQGSWTGTTNGTSTCGAAGQMCSFSACAPAGNYIAIMCANENTGGDAEACPPWDARTIQMREGPVQISRR